MDIWEAKKTLVTKARELSRTAVLKDEIAIEQNAEVLDAIQRTADRELALHSLSRNWKTAGLVADALRRIDDGSFGACAECEEPIGEKRIKAIPWAKYCITCQERFDREGEPDEVNLQLAA